MDEKEKEFLVLKAKLLFQRIKEGKVAFDAENVPNLMQALEAVQFNDNGDPIFETITGPIRALANMVFADPNENLEQEAREREQDSPIHKVLVNATEVTDDILRQCAETGHFEALAFELFKEAGCVVAAGTSVHVRTGEVSGELVFPRNQAICAGLLTRITKFMIAVIQLCASAHRGEVVMALVRSIFESAINLQFLLVKNEDQFYDQFVKFSLAPERELYDVITKNICERDGQALPIEMRMLDSIRRTCELSGITIEETSAKARDWGGDLRSRLKALGRADSYASFQRIPSHAVHGTWVDLILHHLETKNDGFVSNARWTRTDARILGSTALMVLKALRSYLRAFMAALPELNPLYERIDDLEIRLLKLDKAHEQWLQDRYPEDNNAQ
jgi:hypothetical protein